MKARSIIFKTGITISIISAIVSSAPCVSLASETGDTGINADSSSEEIMAYMDGLAENGSISLNDMKQAASAADIRALLNAEDYSSVYGDVLDSMSGNNMMKLSMAIGSQMNIPVPQSIAAEVAVMDYSSIYDTGLLNLQYMALSQSYTDSYTMAESANKAADCMELFNSTYGDIASSLKLETPQIPADFTPDKMVSQMSKQMEKTYKDSTSKGQFASIKNSISIGNIFETAQKGYSGSYDRGMPGISFSSLPSTPLAGAYSSIASQASAKESVISSMKSKGIGMADSAKISRDSRYSDLKADFDAKSKQMEEDYSITQQASDLVDKGYDAMTSPTVSMEIKDSSAPMAPITDFFGNAKEWWKGLWN